MCVCVEILNFLLVLNYFWSYTVCKCVDNSHAEMCDASKAFKMKRKREMRGARVSECKTWKTEMEEQLFVPRACVSVCMFVFL